VQFDAVNGEIFDLRSCCLTPSSSQPMQLRCIIEGQEPLTVARVSLRSSSCRLSARFTGKATLAVSGQGELCVGGLLFSPESVMRGTKRVSPEAAGIVSQDIRPAKRAAPVKPAPAQGASASSKASADKQPASVAASSPKAKVAASPKAKPASSTPASQPAPSALTPEELKVRAKVAMERRAAEAAGKADKPAAEAEAAAEDASSGKNKKKKNKEKEAVPLARRTTATGMQIEVMKAGSGPEAMPGKSVAVKYTGWLADGTCFDKGEVKFRLGLGEVIVGWDEGLKGMRKGEQRRLLVPSRLGYGLTGNPPAIPPNSKLIFQAELLDC